ncbi:hypothetical protein [Spiroplasma platyhelix]|uniref:Uncharacterized protein n=1 Tax=Spiroplasma platyhelix PALS-1 TaxID=1276218 RepID=A0A846U5I6_9MOLU|nr:hypothetical protein [Spiroplasma platyhelix]MBE4704345.1 hypothetical protein [Spiroplasma platyhelix PALS-1]NKE38717.1 hypothetical protein [Spiroplasma platyhelix PALS-1]UJB28927.1 hypothetical protein SPLAT_v1c01620 [Spiroplasma platyhelix PALS-1]
MENEIKEDSLKEEILKENIAIKSKKEFCKKCVEEILPDQDSVQVNNILIKGNYHKDCYIQNKKNIKWLIIASYLIPLGIFLIITGLFLGIFFGIIIPKINKW